MKRHPWYIDYYEPIHDNLLNLSNNICYDKILINKINVDAGLCNLFQYPDAAKTYNVLSKYCNIDVKNLAIGYGAGDIIHRLMMYFKNLSIGILTPTYELAQNFALNLGLTVFNSHNLDDIKTDVLYIANPNGVTGKAITKDQVLSLLPKYKYIIIDEAYADFCSIDCSVAKESLNVNNLIVIKSLSKSVASPGLRFGWCISNKKIIEELQDIRSSTVVTGITHHLLEQLLNECPAHIDRMIHTKNYIENKYSCIPSNGNFVLFKKDPKLKCKIKKTVEGYFRMSLTDIETFRQIENDSATP